MTARCVSRCGDIRPVAEIWPFEIFPRFRHLGFVRTVNSAVRSAVPENPTLEPNMKWIGSPTAEIWPFAYVGGDMEPPFWWEREVVGGQQWHHSKERWWFPIGSKL